MCARHAPPAATAALIVSLLLLAPAAAAQSCAIGGTIDRYGVLITGTAVKTLTIKLSGTRFLASMIDSNGENKVRAMLTGTGTGEWDNYEPTAIQANGLSLSTDRTMLTIEISNAPNNAFTDTITAVVPGSDTEAGGSDITCANEWTIAPLPAWVPALDDLYAATGGAAWGKSTGWGVDYAFPCLWHGVGCDEDGVLEGLFLQGNGLDASSLPALTPLHGVLKYLHIGGNPELTFDLADLQLEAYTELEVFSAHNCGFTSGLPAAWGAGGGALGKLREVHLHRNALTGAVPSQWQSLAAIHTVLLHGNQLTGTLPTWANPAHAGRLATLRKFWVYQNDLTEQYPEHDTLALQEAKYPHSASKRSNDPYNEEAPVP